MTHCLTQILILTVISSGVDDVIEEAFQDPVTLSDSGRSYESLKDDSVNEDDVDVLTSTASSPSSTSSSSSSSPVASCGCSL